jgi:3-isopropylmalate/(R)-2-methylmalate dehydratase large subunit
MGLARDNKPMSTKPSFQLTGHLLFLSQDPACIQAQLSGQPCSLAQAQPLRDDISTDEITPMSVLTKFDDRLGRYPYAGLVAGGITPIGTDAIRHGRFEVNVAGKRFGKGSSREHSPLAQVAAGVRLVIAESFERIYRQNADNLGLFTSTDFGLIPRLLAGEAIAIDELVQGRDAVAAAVLRSGGLLRYGQNSMRKIQAVPLPTQTGPQTLVQKILQRHLLSTEETGSQLRTGAGAFIRADWRFIHEYYTGMATHMLKATFGNRLTLHDKGTILSFEDHLSYVHRSELHLQQGLIPEALGLSTAHRAFVSEFGIRDHGYLGAIGEQPAEGSEGISHALMAEQYALPGQVVVGTDSHTPHSGALGCLAFGVGTTDMANAFVTGAVRLTVPESIKIQLNGKPAPGVTAKDLVLHLLALPKIRAGAGLGRVFEFTGPAIAALSTDERTTLTNMSAELGGFCGIVAPDAETVRFIAERRGVQFALADWMHSDEGAAYADTITLDCSVISPMVAAPGDPGNGIALNELTEREKVEIAYGGSCTAGKREDFDAYHEVLAWAAARGLKVAPGVHLFLQFGTVAVRDYCEEQGYLAAFAAVGAELLQPACGSCANCGPGASVSSEQVTISAINRNFPGRSGPGKVWLASPPTVAASAIAGEIVSFEELRGRFG